MASHGGPHITHGLVLYLDANNRKSSLRVTQSNNLLNDPGNWSVGSGSLSGYNRNGEDSEQNRVFVDNDPWNRDSVTWRTTPSSVSGSDGGWNSSSYVIDNTKLYRYSVWVKRYTSDTGGNFYFGMNPAPIRNDNNTSQANPYFTVTAISNLTQNQWYLVVAHVFPHNYTGGRHPESGWYENGEKISDKSYGNVGTQDVRWDSSTTTALHRAYHYYSTNVNSGIEFAYPRLDLCDGNEPSIKDILNKGESAWKNLISGKYYKVKQSMNYNINQNKSSFIFDGVDDFIDLESDVVIQGDNTGWTSEYFFKTYSASSLQHFNSAENDLFNANWLAILNSKLAIWNVSPGTWKYGSTIIQSNTWYQAVFVCKPGGASYQFYINGEPEGGDHTTYSFGSNYSSLISRYIGRYEHNGSYSRYFNGEIPVVRMYNKPLSQDEIKQNYITLKKRYDL